MTTGNGILIQPLSGSMRFLLSNTISADNGVGISFYPPTDNANANANAFIDHAMTTNNLYGILIITNYGTVGVTISNSTASNNSNTGMYFFGTFAALTATVDSSYASNNSTGIYGDGTANILLGRSFVTSNNTGISNVTSPNTFYSYGDNSINKNGTDVAGTALNTSFTLR